MSDYKYVLLARDEDDARWAKQGLDGPAFYPASAYFLEGRRFVGAKLVITEDFKYRPDSVQIMTQVSHLQAIGAGPDKIDA